MGYGCVIRIYDQINSGKDFSFFLELIIPRRGGFGYFAPYRAVKAEEVLGRDGYNPTAQARAFKAKKR